MSPFEALEKHSKSTRKALEKHSKSTSKSLKESSVTSTIATAQPGPRPLESPPRTGEFTEKFTGKSTADFTDDFGAELDRIRAEVVAGRGAEDARYIRTVIAVQRGLEAGGRLALAVSLLPPAWLAG